MRRVVWFLLVLLVLTGRAEGINELPRDVTRAAPAAADMLPDLTGTASAGEFSAGLGQLFREAGERFPAVMRERLRGIASVLLAVALCGAAGSVSRPGEGLALAVPMAGALSVTALTAGSLESMIGLGWKTIRELNDFSRALLPVLAAASAASGAVTTAAVQRVAAVFLAETLLHLMDGVLMPLLYLYIGTLTASCALPGEPLARLADGIRGLVTALLTGSLLLFSIYLSVSKALSGSADAAAVRMTRAAVTNTVPVVGGILAEATEAVLSGAVLLKTAVGVFGMLAVLAACLYPFLQLGAQYLLYKAAAVLASAVGMPSLCRLIDGLGSAFALVLAMTAGCALLILVSVLVFVTASVS